MVKIKILFEDKNLIIVDKPAGVLAFPLPGSSEKTVGDIVGALPCHRLDRDTSGVMILAKNEKARAEIQTLFKKRNITKKYKTLVWGKVEPRVGEINIPLGRHAKDRLRVVPKIGGRESRTLYKVIKYYRLISERPQINEPIEYASFLVVDLKTGRTHQIRAHFSAIGHPVVGDKKYSNKRSTLDRQFLHAYQISFTNPFTKEVLTIDSELPNDLELFLKSIS